MNYDMTTPCSECPFLKKFLRSFSKSRLDEFASGAFPCHKTAEVNEDEDGFGEFQATKDSQHCAGALIYNEKRNAPNQMMRIAERLGIYDRKKLNMDAEVR